jgi:hypothetical protein
MNDDKLREDYWGAWREATKLYNALIEDLERLREFTLIHQVKQLDSSYEKLRKAEIMLAKNNVNLSD